MSCYVFLGPLSLKMTYSTDTNAKNMVHQVSLKLSNELEELVDVLFIKLLQ